MINLDLESIMLGRIYKTSFHKLTNPQEKEDDMRLYDDYDATRVLNPK